MAVETTHLNLFQDREFMNAISQVNGAAAGYNAQQMRFLGIPSAAALPENQFFHQPAACEAKTSVNTDSGLTYYIPALRKRSRAAAVCSLHSPPPSAVLPALNLHSGDCNDFLFPSR
ncbi:hypothetical protein C2S53_013600 [Perilla frutescens var. hirtella]|uniref:Uncharacterized protein n=1 Tax=Perilla frutescens var. hirtella TaxID=608512 RepID=A0AAD4IYM8_PERFH|nr:hypothetical protein C2S53_013600 [Perilla frutescens var. hirtella]